MAVSTNSLTTYLTQWLKTATKGNVALMSQMTGLAQKFYVFKCIRCLQNWHVGEQLFIGLDDYAIPSELQDWVKDHRHVCKKYINTNAGIQGPCTCGWPFGAHEESWIKPAMLPLDEFKAKWQEQQAKNFWNGNGLGGGAAGIAAGQTMPGKIIHPIVTKDPLVEWYGSWAEKNTPAPAKPALPKPLPEPRGRKFRDVPIEEN